MKIFAVILLFTFFLFGTKVYLEINDSRNLKNIRKNRLNKTAEVLNECFDLKNKNQRTQNNSMKLIEYCLKKYGSEK
tara:strand:+ start:530 stop:760 length:231 start_codon:yes stop_codon:yes gene_type:complete